MPIIKNHKKGLPVKFNHLQTPFIQMDNIIIGLITVLFNFYSLANQNLNLSHL